LCAGESGALDLGCGNGTDTIHLARHGRDVTGIDRVNPNGRCSIFEPIAPRCAVKFCHDVMISQPKLLAVIVL
jgi:hypothetical protein